MGQIPSPSNPGSGAIASLAAAQVLTETHYTGAGGAQANVGAGLVAAEATIIATTAAVAAINARIVTVSKVITSAAVAALGAQGGGVIDFAAALPAGAIVLGGGFNTTTAFQNATDNTTLTAAIGVTGGVTNCFVTATSLITIAKGGLPGASSGSLVGAVLPSILFACGANLSTITKGAGVAYLSYILAF